MHVQRHLQQSLCPGRYLQPPSFSRAIHPGSESSSPELNPRTRMPRTLCTANWLNFPAHNLYGKHGCRYRCAQVVPQSLFSTRFRREIKRERTAAQYGSYCDHGLMHLIAGTNLLAVLTVSPKKLYLGTEVPSTAATTVQYSTQSQYHAAHSTARKTVA